MDLTPIEVRVLGSLMEKAKTTPDAYPLTLNSLVLACNQKTSRDPVTEYDEEEVQEALDSLRDKHLAMRVDMAGSRTAKFRENAASQWELCREEYALLTILLLRGPQTPGQLRQRSERLFMFAELPQVIDWLKRMQEREAEPHSMVTALDRSLGTKEIRYVQTLSPIPEATEVPLQEQTTRAPQSTPETPGTSRLDELEESVLSLQERVEALEKLLNELTS